MSLSFPSAGSVDTSLASQRFHLNNALFCYLPANLFPVSLCFRVRACLLIVFALVVSFLVSFRFFPDSLVFPSTFLFSFCSSTVLSFDYFSIMFQFLFDHFPPSPCPSFFFGFLLFRFVSLLFFLYFCDRVVRRTVLTLSVHSHKNSTAQNTQLAQHKEAEQVPCLPIRVRQRKQQASKPSG